MISLTTHYSWKMSQMDIKTTFLNGDLNEVVYMKQEEGFGKFGNEHLVCKLNKTLYGLCHF